MMTYHIYENSSLSYSPNKKWFRHKLYRKSKHTFHVQNFLSEQREFYEIIWKKYDKSLAGHRWKYGTRKFNAE